MYADVRRIVDKYMGSLPVELHAMRHTQTLHLYACVGKTAHGKSFECVVNTSDPTSPDAVEEVVFTEGERALILECPDLMLEGTVEGSPLLKSLQHSTCSSQAEETVALLLDAAMSAIAHLNMEAQRYQTGLPRHVDDLRQRLCIAVSLAQGVVVCGNLQRAHEIEALLAKRGRAK